MHCLTRSPHLGHARGIELTHRFWHGLELVPTGAFGMHKILNACQYESRSVSLSSPSNLLIMISYRCYHAPRPLLVDLADILLLDTDIEMPVG